MLAASLQSVGTLANRRSDQFSKTKVLNGDDLQTFKVLVYADKVPATASCTDVSGSSLLLATRSEVIPVGSEEMPAYKHGIAFRATHLCETPALRLVGGIDRRQGGERKRAELS